VIDNFKVCVGVPFILIKKTQSIFQKSIIWTKKSGKGQQKWHKVGELIRVPPWKLKTPMKTHFASRVVLFQDTFEFKNVIVFCYGRQQLLALKGCVPSPQV
jgi:hypothetical protein